MSAAIRLRFVQSAGFLSDLIEYREGTVMPFCPTHVEAVDGDHYIGQHAIGGMQARPVGYDAPFNAETFVDLPCSEDQRAEFYRWVHAAIGEPYDMDAILGFALTGHHHEKMHAICSAKMFLGLRHVDWFPSHAPLCVPAHCVNPRDLLLIISAIALVEH